MNRYLAKLIEISLQNVFKCLREGNFIIWINNWVVQYQIFRSIADFIDENQPEWIEIHRCLLKFSGISFISFQIHKYYSQNR